MEKVSKGHFWPTSQILLTSVVTNMVNPLLNNNIAYREC